MLILSILLFSTTKAFPTINHGAKSILIREINTGVDLLKDNEKLALDPASLLKIIVFLAVIKHTSKDDRINTQLIVPKTVKNLSSRSTSMHLVPGMKVSLEDLLVGLITASANDAAITIAEHFSTTEKQFMAQYVKPILQELKLDHVQFNNASGLDGSGQSSVNDLVKVLTYINEHHFDEYIEYFKWKEFVFNKTLYTSQNIVKKCNNGKTGYLESIGYSFATIQESNIGKVVLVALGWNHKQDRLNNMQNLIQWTQKQYMRYTIDTNISDDIEYKVQIKGGLSNAIHLVKEKDIALILPKYLSGVVRIKISYPKFIYAPVKKNQRIGKIKLALDNGNILEYHLVSPQEVEEAKGMLKYITLIKNAFGY